MRQAQFAPGSYGPLESIDTGAVRAALGEVPRSSATIVWRLLRLLSSMPIAASFEYSSGEHRGTVPARQTYRQTNPHAHETRW
jgi:hypothetical protein